MPANSIRIIIARSRAEISHAGYYHVIAVPGLVGPAGEEDHVGSPPDLGQDAVAFVQEIAGERPRGIVRMEIDDEGSLDPARFVKQTAAVIAHRRFA